MSAISNNVGKKARIIWAARRLTGRRAAEVYVFAVGWIFLSYIVSIPHIFANMPSLGNLAGTFGFFMAAITHTHLAVQITLGAIAAVFVVLVVDMFRGIVPNHLRQVSIQ